MSRVSLIEQLYAPKRKTALEFNYDALWAPPIRALLTQEDINQLYHVATSLQYNDDINRKYELIDAVMKRRGFKRGNCGTNRVVYNFPPDKRFCMKIALDRVGIKDSPAEFKNQEYFKPFCCKIFEVDPTGVIACVERVNPISSMQEFASIADDVFNMMVTKIIGKYVVDDLGIDKFMNYGVRYDSNGISFGPVILDFPYAYELDSAKLKCGREINANGRTFICRGDIDYDAGLNNLICCKCGRVYTARELAKDDSSVIKFYPEGKKNNARVRIVRGSDNAVLYDSIRKSKIFLSREEFEEGNRVFYEEKSGPRPVSSTVNTRRKRKVKEIRTDYYNKLKAEAMEAMRAREEAFLKANKVSRRKSQTMDSEPKAEEEETAVGTHRYDYEPVRRAYNNDENVGAIAAVLGAINEALTDVQHYGDTLDDFIEVVHEPYDADNKGEAIYTEADYPDEPVEYEEDQQVTDEDATAEPEPEMISEDEESEETSEEDVEEASDQDSIEDTAFPEIAANGTKITFKDDFEEPDYSNYEPPEEDIKVVVESTEDSNYDKYYNDGKKSGKKKQKHNNTNDDDMNAY